MGILSGLTNKMFGSQPKFDVGEWKRFEDERLKQWRTGQTGPFGDISWVGDTLKVELSPFEQAKYDAAAAMLPSLTQNYGDEAAKRAEEAVYGQFLNRMQPRFDEQRQQAQNALLNQGLAVGSDAYNNAMRQLDQNQNDAWLQAQNQSVLTGQQSQTQQLANALSLFGTMQNINNPIDTYMPGIGASMENPYSQQLADEQNRYNSRMEANSQLFSELYHNLNGDKAFGQLTGLLGSVFGGAGGGGGGGGLGSLGGLASGVMSMFSDERLKDVLVRNVGRLNNGIALHLFRFKGEDDLRVGVIAQEVAEVMPQAVLRDEKSGLLGVDYAVLLGLDKKPEGKEHE